MNGKQLYYSNDGYVVKIETIKSNNHYIVIANDEIWSICSNKRELSKAVQSLKEEYNIL